MSHVSLRWTFLGLAPTCISNRCLLRKVDCMLLLILGEKLLASILAGFVPLVSQFGLLSAADSPPMYSASQNGHVMDIEDVDMTKTVADPGDGPGGPASSPLDQREEIFLGDWVPPLSKGLDDPPPPPPLLLISRPGSGTEVCEFYSLSN